MKRILFFSTLLLFGAVTISQAQVKRSEAKPLIIDKNSTFTLNTPVSKSVSNLLNRNATKPTNARVINASNAIPRSDASYQKLFTNRATYVKPRILHRGNADSKGLLEKIKLYGTQKID